MHFRYYFRAVIVNSLASHTRLHTKIYWKCVKGSVFKRISYRRLYFDLLIFLGRKSAQSGTLHYMQRNVIKDQYSPFLYSDILLCNWQHWPVEFLIVQTIAKKWVKPQWLAPFRKLPQELPQYWCEPRLCCYKLNSLGVTSFGYAVPAQTTLYYF